MKDSFVSELLQSKMEKSSILMAKTPTPGNKNNMVSLPSPQLSENAGIAIYIVA